MEIFYKCQIIVIVSSFSIQWCSDFFFYFIFIISYSKCLFFRNEDLFKCKERELKFNNKNQKNSIKCDHFSQQELFFFSSKSSVLTNEMKKKKHLTNAKEFDLKNHINGIKTMKRV